MFLTSVGFDDEGGEGIGKSVEFLEGEFAFAAFQREIDGDTIAVSRGDFAEEEDEGGLLAVEEIDVDVSEGEHHLAVSDERVLGMAVHFADDPFRGLRRSGSQIRDAKGGVRDDLLRDDFDDVDDGIDHGGVEQIRVVLDAAADASLRALAELHDDVVHGNVRRHGHGVEGQAGAFVEGERGGVLEEEEGRELVEAVRLLVDKHDLEEVRRVAGAVARGGEAIGELREGVLLEIHDRVDRVERALEKLSHDGVAGDVDGDRARVDEVADGILKILHVTVGEGSSDDDFFLAGEFVEDDRDDGEQDAVHGVSSLSGEIFELERKFGREGEAADTAVVRLGHWSRIVRGEIERRHWAVLDAEERLPLLEHSRGGLTIAELQVTREVHHRRGLGGDGRKRLVGEGGLERFGDEDERPQIRDDVVEDDLEVLRVGGAENANSHHAVLGEIEGTNSFVTHSVESCLRSKLFTKEGKRFLVIIIIEIISLIIIIRTKTSTTTIRRQIITATSTIFFVSRRRISTAVMLVIHC